MAFRFSIFLALGAASAQVATGQAPASLHGVLSDSATGAPVAGARVMVAPGRIQTHVRELVATDSAGRYAIDSLPPGPRRVTFWCPGTLPNILLFARRRVQLGPGEARVLDLRLPPGLCDEPPRASRAGVHEGRYTVGFEASEFIPCPGPGVPRRLIGRQVDSTGFHGYRAWVTWTERSRAAARGRRWPAVPPDRWGHMEYFVRWRGTLVGPSPRDGYFHTADYTFTVDSVLEVRAPRAGDCRPAHRPPAP